MSSSTIFNATTTQIHLQRLDKLTNSTSPKWGTMNAAQMLAHLNIAYSSSDSALAPKVGLLNKLVMKLFVKGVVVGDKPHTKNSRTATNFIVANERDFEKEKSILIHNIKDVEVKGLAYFEGRENPAFGKLTGKEWSNLFGKHLEHHFEHFGI